MSEKRLWNKIIEFNDQYFPNWRENKNLIYYSNALAGEVGEICNITKHLAGGGTNNEIPSKGKFIEETVDVFIYLVLLLEASLIDFDKWEIWFDSKMDINKQRMESRLRQSSLASESKKGENEK